MGSAALRDIAIRAGFRSTSRGAIIWSRYRHFEPVEKSLSEARVNGEMSRLRSGALLEALLT